MKDWFAVTMAFIGGFVIASLIWYSAMSSQEPPRVMVIEKTCPECIHYPNKTERIIFQ